MSKENNVSIMVGDLAVSCNTLKTCKKTLKGLLNDPDIQGYLKINKIKRFGELGEASYIN